jgi:hypothetical protein
LEVVMAVVDSREPQRLVDYIGSRSDFKKYTEIGDTYRHVGAILADAVLQANTNYERVVRCRVGRIRKDYARETSLEDLKQVLKGITVQDFLKWNGTRKPKTFRDLICRISSDRTHPISWDGYHPIS